MDRTRPARFRLLWVFGRRCLLYNIVLSLLGAGAVFVFNLVTNTDASDVLSPTRRSFDIAVPMTAILIGTVGHALALLAMRVFHHRELPYYRNGGIGEGFLSLGSWVMAVCFAALAYAAGSVWT